MSDEEERRILDEYARKYPAMITYGQAVEIFQGPINTLYDWSARGLFDAFKARGRTVLLGRDAFVRFLIRRNEKRQ